MVNVGEYVILKEIGQAPLGKLFLAEHKLLKRKAAIKFLPASLVADSEFSKRFEKELVILSSLKHPHLVGIQNAGLQEKQPYLVFDWVSKDDEPSINLYDLSKKGKELSEDSLYEIALQIASALDSVHSVEVDGKPLAHMGIKLNNILVQMQKQDIHVYLTDLGLSRLFSTGSLLSYLYQECFKHMKQKEKKSAKETESKAIEENSFWQSFQCLAPEQKKIHGVLSSEKADTYAFGVLFYYLLMNEYPEGWFPLPSSKRDPLKYDWDRLITDCLQMNPSSRPSLLLPLVESLVSHASKFQISTPQVVAALKTETAVAGSSTGAYKLQLKPGEIQRPQFEPDPGAVFQTESVVVRYQPAMQEMKNIEPLLTEMIIIPEGAFQRGSNQGGRDEAPRHQIHLSAFAMDLHPVTNEQFVRFLEAMGGEKDGNNNDMIRLRESRIKRSGGKLNIESGYARHPVVGVTWYGASAYAKWVGKRLPTEAEWEIAACGGAEDALYPTGKNIERTQANFFSSDTTAVMSYPPNCYGLYDMAGNVYEWCNDWYDYHYYDLSVQEPDNPKGPLQGVYRILRGGCWKSLKEDMRCSHRHRNNPGTMNGTYGFRCAADVSAN
jgi:formylglycine-generating enzyme required for sulfatase activity